MAAGAKSTTTEVEAEVRVDLIVARWVSPTSFQNGTFLYALS